MPRELTSCDSVGAPPTAEPLVQRTIKGSLILKRCADRRSGYATQSSSELSKRLFHSQQYGQAAVGSIVHPVYAEPPGSLVPWYYPGHLPPARWAGPVRPPACRAVTKRPF